MVFPRMRALVSGVLFVAWLGFLGYLVSQTRGRVIVARPQIERSNLIIVATLTEANGRPAANVAVTQALHPKGQEQLVGWTFDLDELANLSSIQGWAGPGDYVVPLTRKKVGDVSLDRVTPLPVVPGRTLAEPRIYPATDDVLKQVRAIVSVGERE